MQAPVESWQSPSVATLRRKRKTDDPTRELAGLPKRLDEAIENSGELAKTIAEHANFDAGQLSRLRAGKQLLGVAADGLVRLAHALGVPSAWLITGRSWAPFTVAREQLGEDWTHLEIRPGEDGAVGEVIPYRRNDPIVATDSLPVARQRKKRE